MPKPRVVTVIVCVTGLCTLSAASGSANAFQAGAGTTERASAAVNANTGPGAHLITLGRQGWQVQSSAATTDWTTGTGATASGNEISAPGFDTTGWLPVAADDAGAVGTEVEALLQNGVCPDDPGLQPVNQSTSGPHSVFYSDNMALCFGAPMTSTGA